MLSALKSHLFTWLYSQGCTNSYDLWRRPWIGFTCYGAIEMIVILLLLLKASIFHASVLETAQQSDPYMSNGVSK